MKNDNKNTWRSTIKQWRNITEIVDVETGEIISKSTYERLDYYTIKTELTKTDLKNEKGYRYFTKQARKRGQYRLKL